MSSCREIIEGFIYPHLERFTDMVYRGGEDTVFMNVRLLDDESRFTHGALVCGACILFAHYKKIEDPRADIAKERLCEFIRIAASSICKTWGKLGILRGFNLLSERGLLSEIPSELIEAIKEKTDYDDFFDKETLTLRNMATNYLHVAMACAGYREQLGWENDGISAKISNILVDIFNNNSEGWMDDEIPYGRYDRYTFAITSEFAYTAADIGLQIPKIVLDNLTICARDMLFMANSSGDGILYGRSVACHGDLGGAEIIASAFANKLIDEGDKDLALAYCYASFKKVVDFWYDKRLGTFNIWFNGRSTNRYRPFERVLEVNLDMSIHLFTTLKNLERAGVADTEIISKIPESDKWESMTVRFSKSETEERALVVLKRGGKIMFIPFVGLGKKWGRRVAYHPFPVIARLIEASPTAEYPFMIPEYVDKEGNLYRPCQYFTEISVESGDDKVTATARGYLSVANTITPAKNDIPFTHTITVSGNTITIKTECDGDFDTARTYYGASDNQVVIKPFGFEEIKSTAPEKDTDGINQSITSFIECQTKKTNELGCVISLPI